jgi:ATP-binding cassette subfamily B protein
VTKREFTVAGAHAYDQRDAVHWIVSHLARYTHLAIAYMLISVLANVCIALVAVQIGNGFNDVLLGASGRAALTRVTLTLVGLAVLTGIFDLGARSLIVYLGKRFSRDARDELYVALLGKSQTFHNRQRVGDIMARAANDVGQLADMVVPGFDTIFDSSTNLVMPLVFISFLQPQLLLAPLAFIVLFVLALRRYMRQLKPVSAALREQFGTLNAGLTEAVTGIEVVKATAQEAQERAKFAANARAYRDLFVANGRIQGQYLPPLLLAVILAGALLHGLYLVSHSQLSVGGLVTYLGLVGMLRFPTFISIFAYSLVQLGVAAADRILAILRDETDLDANDQGFAGPMSGEIVFEHVAFGYGEEEVLHDISFRAAPGQTVAIVGQTGSGKSTLTRLVNRIYDVTGGRILIDGIDVRDWQLASLRSQIATIEQDIFLFSRTVAENIAFGLGGVSDRQAIEQAARDAQAHDFIMGFRDGYDTVIGERGVTLSGGQRQRLAIARALLTDPRILILDDSTSAIDSQTEDEIQKAMQRLSRGRTTLLVTHRLSQIRSADWVLVLRGGRIVDQGTHTDLLARSALYRRIFAHYEPALSVAATGT